MSDAVKGQLAIVAVSGSILPNNANAGKLGRNLGVALGGAGRTGRHRFLRIPELGAGRISWFAQAHPIVVQILALGIQISISAGSRARIISAADFPSSAVKLAQTVAAFSLRVKICFFAAGFPVKSSTEQAGLAAKLTAVRIRIIDDVSIAIAGNIIRVVIIFYLAVQRRQAGKRTALQIGIALLRRVIHRINQLVIGHAGNFIIAG